MLVQIIHALNIPGDIKSYVFAVKLSYDEVKLKRPLYDLSTVAFMDIAKTLTYIIIRGD